MVGYLREYFHDGEVADECDVRSYEGYDAENKVVRLFVRGKIVIPKMWLMWQVASENLNLRLTSAELQQTITGRKMLEAIQTATLMRMSYQEAQQNPSWWEQIDDFLVVDTKGGNDLGIMLNVPGRRVELVDSTGQVDYDLNGGNVIMYLTSYHSPHLWLNRDGKVVFTHCFRDFLEEKTFNQVMINMCQGRVALKTLNQFMLPESDPEVDKLVVRDTNNLPRRKMTQRERLALLNQQS